jgi:hypothetical protein
MLSRSILEVASFTAEEFEIFLAISPFALKHLISSEDLKTWMTHLHADSKLVQDHFVLRKLPKLGQKIAKWKEVNHLALPYPEN